MQYLDANWHLFEITIIITFVFFPAYQLLIILKYVNTAELTLDLFTVKII